LAEKGKGRGLRSTGSCEWEGEEIAREAEWAAEIRK